MRQYILFSFYYLYAIFYSHILILRYHYTIRFLFFILIYRKNAIGFIPTALLFCHFTIYLIQIIALSPFGTLQGEPLILSFSLSIRISANSAQDTNALVQIVSTLLGISIDTSFAQV